MAYNPWKGRKVSELVDFSPTALSGMAPRELRSLITRISSAANKRLRSLERTGLKGPAYANAQKGGGRFSAKGKSDNELIGEYLRVQRFMKSGTSTVKGARAMKDKIREDIESIDESWGDDGEGTYWDLFNKWIEVAEGKGLTRYQISEIIAQAMNSSFDYADIEENIRDAIEEEYRKREGAISDYDSGSPNIIV